ncbi:MAG TPA: DNA repair protein RecO [Rhodopila sp.]|uniref:DNA repair protein RecO n=1 Tax=Rhodopila sp. TaxID=2480087 RepID=UPI002C5CE0CD|nr:DNA repair protein RecO [Rhodopila sp.]HVY16137.1 DNA repair protein RecO [Rhodopila sp.]
MEWSAPAVVLNVRPFGDADALATVMTEAHGVHRGLVRGGASRAKAATWLAGNLLVVQWTGRLSEQLGAFTGELVYAGAALAMDDPLGLAMMTAVCTTADGAMPEREAHPRVFQGLVDLVPRIVSGESALTALVGWELTLLSDLGYGLDLSDCAVTGQTEGLAYVSPRTGRAVTEAAAGIWRSRLLPLPGFLVGPDPPDYAAWRDGLRLTGHFLARDAFGLQHKPLPQARVMLYDRVSALADAMDKDEETIHAG